MAVYKVIQDVEAEDKLLGWMSLKQFIFFCVALGSAYMTFFSIVKGFGWAIIFFLPITLVCGLLAAPLSKVQPTEVWLAARIRFFIKPRRRIWDQTGASQLVTVTAPKLDKHIYTNNLSQGEVVSRLNALARTLDSRGWAVRNVNANLYAQPSFASTNNSNDRLVRTSSLPAQVPTIAVAAEDDILDAQSNAVARRFDQKVRESTAKQHQQAIDNMFQAQTKSDGLDQIPELYSAVNVLPSQGPAAPSIVESLDPSLVDIGIVENIKAKKTAQKSANIPEPLLKPLVEEDYKKMTDIPNSAMINLANNNELSLRTIASQAKRVNEEVVINLR
jgi:hypothetical protein